MKTLTFGIEFAQRRLTKLTVRAYGNLANRPPVTKVSS